MKAITGEEKDNVYGLSVDEEGNLVVVGIVGMQGNLGAGPITTAGGHDGYLARYDGSNGDLLGAITFGGSGYSDLGRSVQAYAPGYAVVVGQFSDSADLFGVQATSQGDGDAFVALVPVP